MLSTFVVLILTASVNSESALVRPVVTFTPPWRHILSGQSVTISCDVGTLAQEDETFYWYKDEKLIAVYEQNFTVQSASDVYNGGDYQCRTSTSDISDPVNLIVSYGYIVLQKPPHIYEGDSLTLRCYSHPFYNGINTTFYKDGREIQFSVSNSDLHIDKVDVSATGTYRCTKTLRDEEFFSRSSETYVYVRGDEVKPMVTFTPNWMRILPMDSVTLTCNVASAEQEKETFYWYKDGKVINIQTQNFTIRSAYWRTDYGYYQCRSNTSDISEPAKLDIRGDFILQRPPSIYEGDPLTLRCLSGSSFNVINTTFYKDDNHVKFSSTDTELHIDKVDRSMTGVYKCVQQLQSKPSGRDGTRVIYRTFSSVSFITVRAITRPVVTLTPSWGNLLSGDSVTLTCVTGSAGQDNQTFYWYKDEKILNITTRSFALPSASGRDSGSYKCRTGSSDMSFPKRLEVTNADVVMQRDASSTYEGAPLTLRCHSRSQYKTINTTFYKEGLQLQISANDSTLRINQLHRRDTGNYKCSQLLQSQDGAFFVESEQTYIYVKDITHIHPSTPPAPWARPMVTLTPSWGNILPGDTVTLTCDAGPGIEGRTSYHWYKDGKPLRIILREYTIHSATQWNNGEYQCRFGSGDISFPTRLYVKKGVPVVILTPPWGSIYSGGSVTLTCHMKSFEGDKQTYHWYKDDEKLRFTQRHFTIPSATRRYNGHYKCKTGSSDMSFPTRLDVKDGTPVVTLMPNSGNLLPGDSVTLTCVAGPAIQDRQTYYWYKDEEPFNITQRNFTIPSVSSRDNGEYMCRTKFSDQSLPVKLEVTDGRTNERDTNGISE